MICAVRSVQVDTLLRSDSCIGSGGACKDSPRLPSTLSRALLYCWFGSMEAKMYLRLLPLHVYHLKRGDLPRGKCRTKNFFQDVCRACEKGRSMPLQGPDYWLPLYRDAMRARCVCHTAWGACPGNQVMYRAQRARCSQAQAPSPRRRKEEMNDPHRLLCGVRRLGCRDRTEANLIPIQSTKIGFLTLENLGAEQGMVHSP